jgi:hypothetical protein
MMGAGFVSRVGEERVLVGKVSESIRENTQRWEDHITTHLTEMCYEAMSWIYMDGSTQ